MDATQKTPERRARTVAGEHGQGLIEYALILILIAVVVVLILTVVGHQTQNVFSNVSHGLST